MESTRCLVIIDPQNMFMPLPGMPLPVANADKDMLHVAFYLLRNPFQYDAIIVSFDTHPGDHIAHDNRWVNDKGEHPAPFSVITSADFRAGKWKAANPSDQDWQGEYLSRLEDTGRVHTIWPVHGREGEFEYEVHASLRAALKDWEDATAKKVRYIKKGMHRDTEQFGAFGANVLFPGAPETGINRELIDEINSYSAIDYVGEASSHCVKDSVEQNLAHVPEADWSKYTVFRDCMSPVGAVIDPETGEVIVDFPAQAEAWFAELQTRGVNVASVADSFSS